jgi:hypothetical protein
MMAVDLESKVKSKNQKPDSLLKLADNYGNYLIE